MFNKAKKEKARAEAEAREAEAKVKGAAIILRAKVVAAVKSNDTKKLESFLEQEPSLLEQTYKWEGDAYVGSLLHVAASYDRSDIVSLLVTDKGMDINKFSKNNWTALHHAAIRNAYKAVETLLNLGADPALKNSADKPPYELCKDEQTKEMLSAHRHKKTDQEVTETASDSAAKVAGAWTTISADEIMHERDLPGHRYHLTDVFNFETKRLISITENLQTGQLVQETKFFDEMGDKAVLKEAAAKLGKKVAPTLRL